MNLFADLGKQLTALHKEGKLGYRLLAFVDVFGWEHDDFVKTYNGHIVLLPSEEVSVPYKELDKFPLDEVVRRNFCTEDLYIATDMDAMQAFRFNGEFWDLDLPHNMMTKDAEGALCYGSYGILLTGISLSVTQFNHVSPAERPRKSLAFLG